MYESEQVTAPPSSFERKSAGVLVFGRFSEVFGRLSDVFGWLSQVSGRLSHVFGRLSYVFGRLLAIGDGFSLILTAFRYRKRCFADRPYPFFFLFFYGREAPEKKKHETKTGAWWTREAPNKKISFRFVSSKGPSLQGTL